MNGGASENPFQTVVDDRLEGRVVATKDQPIGFGCAQRLLGKRIKIRIFRCRRQRRQQDTIHHESRSLAGNDEGEGFLVGFRRHDGDIEVLLTVHGIELLNIDGSGGGCD